MYKYVRVLVRCTDVNPAAAQCTAKTASCNDVPLQPVITSLVSLLRVHISYFSHTSCARIGYLRTDVAHFPQVDGLLPRLSGKVDVLLFNPPYVVTPSEEVRQNSIRSPLVEKKKSWVEFNTPPPPFRWAAQVSRPPGPEGFGAERWQTGSCLL